MIYTHVAAFIAGLALAAASTWHIQAWRYDAQIADMQGKQASESAKAEAATRAQEASFNQRLQDAQNAATKRETKLRADADTARRTADGLRDTIHSIRADLPSYSQSAAAKTADTAAELLQQCADEYRSVAEKADRHAADSVMLLEAWPK